MSQGDAPPIPAPAMSSPEADAEQPPAKSRIFSAAAGLRAPVWLGAAFALFIALTAGIVLWNDYRDALRAAERTTQDLSRLAEAHTGRLLDATDLLVRQAGEIAGSESFETLGASYDRWLALRRSAEALNFIESVWIGDHTGLAVLTNIRFPAPRASAADRDYFLAHTGGKREIFIGPPIRSRVTEQDIINVSRGLYWLDGRLRGFVNASLYVAYFEAFYRQLDTPDLAIEIVRDDGRVVMRNAPGEASRPHYPLPEATQPFITTRGVSSVDGIDRLYSMRKIEKYPLYVTVGLPVARVLGGWRDRVAIYAALSLSALLTVGALTALVWRRARSEALAQRRLTQSERRFRAIFNNTFQLTGLLEPDGTILEINQSALAFLGQSGAEVVGRKLWELQAWSIDKEAPARVRAAVREAAAGKVVRYEVELLRPDGSVANVDFSLKPVTDADGRVRMLLPEARDITERKRAEATAIQAQKMEAVGHLTGGVAHDFNNLLTVISGNLELIARDVAQSGRLKRFVEAATRAADRGQRLTQHLLSFSRKQRLNPRPVAFAELIGELHELLRSSLGATIELDVRIEADLWRTEADPYHLELVMLNLAINARDAMPDGGRLTISANNVELAPGHGLGTLAPGAYVRIAMTDTGVGMTKDVLAQAFEPFFTTKDVGKGSGLGLSMVYGFATQSNGHVAIASEPGRGTTVTLYLPKAQVVAAPAAMPREAASSS